MKKEFTVSLIIAVLCISALIVYADSQSSFFGSNKQPSTDLSGSRREVIEKIYPEFKDFENQPSFAGQSVTQAVENKDYYFAYQVLGSGLPIIKATCFRVDRIGQVFKIGVFPDPADSYIGYSVVDPRNCRGQK